MREQSQALVVTVFGSSRAEPDGEEYRSAMRLGTLIAQKGWTLCNGGHEGTMEAASRGAKEVGGRTIGVSFKVYRGPRPNRWLDDEVIAETLFARLEKLVTLGDAYIVLRGGIGTLLELALVWNLVQSQEFAHKPVVVVGDSWAQVMEAWTSSLPMWPWEAAALHFAPSVDEAIAFLAAKLSTRQSRAAPSRSRVREDGNARPRKRTNAE